MTFYIAFSLANSCYLEFAEDFGESFINWKHLEVTFHQTDLFKQRRHNAKSLYIDRKIFGMLWEISSSTQ